MKKAIFKIKAVFLAIAILFASNSYAINSHFCGEQLVAVSYFGNEVSCEMETAEDDCDDSTSTSKDCCSNTLTFIDVEKFKTIPEFSGNFEQVHFLAFFVLSYINLFQKEIALKKERFKDFPPPDIELDIQILHQVFLI